MSGFEGVWDYEEQQESLLPQGGLSTSTEDLLADLPPGVFDTIMGSSSIRAPATLPVPMEEQEDLLPAKKVDIEAAVNDYMASQFTKMSFAGTVVEEKYLIPMAIDIGELKKTAKIDTCTYTFVEDWNTGTFRPYPKGDSPDKTQIAAEIAFIIAFIPWGLQHISGNIMLVIMHAYLLANRRCIGCKPNSKGKVIMGTCYCDKHMPKASEKKLLDPAHQFAAIYKRQFSHRYIGIKAKID